MRKLRILIIAIPMMFLAMSSGTATRASNGAIQAVGDSLWLGNDHVPPATHAQPDGTLINSLTENITGFAYDGQFLYSASADSLQLTRRDPSDGSSPVLLAPNPDHCGGVCEDLAFDGQFIWRMEHANTTIHKLDATTGALVESIALTVADPGATLDPLGGYGVAWDGTKLWLSFGPQLGCTAGPPCGVVETYDIASATLNFEFHTDFVPGGLAFDPAGNLWAGSFGNQLRKLTTTGTVLATIDVPDHSGGFIDGLEYIAVDPDLVVKNVSNPPAIAVLGQKFTITDTTRNQGGTTAGASTTRYYLSLDNVKSAGDKRLAAKRTVPTLGAGAESTGTAKAKIPNSTKVGTYFLLACADDLSVVAESNEGNNCTAADTTVEVRAPDLVQTAVSNPPATAHPGNTFSITDTVRNDGDANANASTTRYRLSLDTKKSGTDVLLTGSRSVPLLAPGAISTSTGTATIPGGTASGSYFLLVCADDLKKVAESNEKNNCKASTNKITVTP